MHISNKLLIQAITISLLSITTGAVFAAGSNANVPGDGKNTWNR